MPTFWLVMAGIAGACVGSFLNVVVWRLPRGENLSVPGSHCPKCNRGIRWFDNLPVLSWLLLRARCRGCRAPISARYPFVEALTAGLFVLAAWRYPGWPEAASVALLLAGLVAITFIDIDHRIIPDAITKPGMVIGLVLALVTTLHPGDWTRAVTPGLARLLHAAAGLVLGLLIIWGVRLLGTLLFRKEAMGLGDAKLLGLIGTFTGPIGTFYTLLVACLGGTLVHGLVLAVTGRRAKPLRLELRGVGGGEARVERAWAKVDDGPGKAPGTGTVRLTFDGVALPAGPLKVRAVLPKNRVLMDEDVVWTGAAEPLADGSRPGVRLVGLTPETQEHWEYYAHSHRYLPFGPYLALGGAAVVLFLPELEALLAWLAGLILRR